MIWKNNKDVSQLIHSLQALQALGVPWQMGEARRHHTSPAVCQARLQKWSAQTRSGWHCPLRSYFKFGFHTTLKKEPLPSHLAKPWTRLENQLANEKKPEVKALLQKSAELKKTKAAGVTRELLLKDQRAKSGVRAQKPTSTVDKQQEVIRAAHAKLQGLRKELATVYVDLNRLPVRESLTRCGFNWGNCFCQLQSHRRSVRGELAQVCNACVDAHLKQLLRAQP
eukprot:3144081-Amphidinium_carterae.3